MEENLRTDKFMDRCLQRQGGTKFCLRSCWAFSTAAGIEGINAISTGKLIGLSEQQLMDCDKKSNACNGGLVKNALDWVVSNGGIASDADYPYKGKNETCRKPPEVKNSAFVKGYNHLPNSDNEILCATAIQPISVCLNATGFKNYESVIPILC
ncbi:unnamed protein product [Lupinus luteus]|uniref:Peptidase C1A papain C-terminal domain-containing protein n=1 Tax=Lupinus luteus TaxID=3873 RepID=A0AAV1W5N2_LUPLU